MSGENNAGRPSAAGLVLLGLLLAGAAVLHLSQLGHAYSPGWDEAIHAAVSGNMARHPLVPTLIDRPLLDCRPEDWQANHVWLHKPPLPFWQAALSVKLLGRSFFALRLPSLLLFLATLLGVYWLGLRWLSEEAGLLAALLLASSPLGYLLVQGAHFGDMTDVSLCAWLLAALAAVEASLRTGRARWALLAGACQAAAWLSKSALALPLAGAVLAVWLLGVLRREKEKPPAHLPALLWGATALAAVGWGLYCHLRWPQESALENRALWAHVTSSFEGHGKPWHALWNELPANLLMPSLVIWLVAGALWLAASLRRDGSAGRRLMFFCIFGTLLPLHLVSTKVTALLWGVAPVMFLAAAGMLSRAVRRPGPMALSLLLAPTLSLLVLKLVPAVAGWPGLLLQGALFAALAAVFWLCARIPLGRLRSAGKTAVALLARAALVLPLLWLVLEQSRAREFFATFSQYNPAAVLAKRLDRQLSEEDALVWEGVTDGRQRPEYTISFLLGRSAQLLDTRRIPQAAARAASAGEQFLVTPVEKEAEPLLSPVPGAAFWVYRLDGQGATSRRHDISLSPAGENDGALEILDLEKTSAHRESPLWVLAVWQAGVGVTGCFTSAWLRDSAGQRLSALPEVGPLPAGTVGEALAKLAPPGWLGGARPIGSGLWSTFDVVAGAWMADGFYIWIPARAAPGEYSLELNLHCPGQPLATAVPLSGNWYLRVLE